ncbi:hypothetical protein [Geitlerinema calcuttense]|uniref:Nitroreductase n=1 Tax=Geitlerinema calcuttense NRMC-F 0142 TaxID=2922238 RepID=A0ABT7LYX4_9CYAN|nr:hypothetical protein [Geitlerinema calcuttense]MDI9637628.1 hypothetical protein [Geitlerinema splendidum]MDL5057199.1 hypothetical protein [Geitlerinema calcuttense NRMC-F 0142]
MTEFYSTEDLIAILNQERRACIRGQRLNLAAKASGSPVIDQFLQIEGVQKFSAYQDFKATVHHYQREHQVSGVVWRTITLGEKSLRFPVVDEQLIALEGDMAILKAAKESAIAFWQTATQGMDLYLILNQRKDYQQIQMAEAIAIAQRTEWASLMKWEKHDFLEIVLQLGWGKPEEAAYKRGWPASGSEYIHAVKPGAKPIC